MFHSFFQLGNGYICRNFHILKSWLWSGSVEKQLSCKFQGWGRLWHWHRWLLCTHSGLNCFAIFKVACKTVQRLRPGRLHCTWTETLEKHHAVEIWTFCTSGRPFTNKWTLQFCSSIIFSIPVYNNFLFSRLLYEIYPCFGPFFILCEIAPWRIGSIRPLCCSYMNSPWWLVLLSSCCRTKIHVDLKTLFTSASFLLSTRRPIWLMTWWH